MCIPGKVRRGDRVVITGRGVPPAALVPPDEMERRQVAGVPLEIRCPDGEDLEIDARGLGVSHRGNDLEATSE